MAVKVGWIPAYLCFGVQKQSAGPLLGRGKVAGMSSASGSTHLPIVSRHLLWHNV